MTLLDTLKSLLGLETSDRRREDQGEVGVTVEREPAEPDAGTERAVKTDEAEPAPVSSPSTDEGDAGTPADDEGTTEAEPDEPPEPSIPDAEADESAGPEAAGGSDEPTDVLEGIGPAYAERLADAGVETVGQLAAADAEALAEEADVSESRLRRWIERANDF